MDYKKLYQAFFKALKGELCGGTTDVFAALSQEETGLLLQLGKEHDLGHFIGSAALRAGVTFAPELEKALKKQKSLAMFRHTQQAFEFSAVCQTLEENKIPFMPLKGSVLREYYPEAWLRTSCDIDVLVPKDKLDLAVAALQEKLGYQQMETSTHDRSLYAPSGVHLELHFSLNEPEYLTIPMLEEIWQIALPVKGTAFERQMSKELFLFYHIYHTAKHFIGGGCGIKAFMDLWIIRQKMGVDEQKTLQMLEEYGLKTFAQAAFALSDAWFGENAPDFSVMTDMQQYVVSGGVNGTQNQLSAVRQVKQGGKGASIRRKIFLSYSELCRAFPSLKKCPALFPFYQVARWFRILFTGRRKQAIKTLKAETSVTKDQQQRVQTMLDKLQLLNKEK